ncbi:MAG: hypothetical protein JNM09_27180 [Blastocatellia bacterium]|nr:hypothetical protein [Blastocatellia bacterium]
MTQYKTGCIIAVICCLFVATISASKPLSAPQQKEEMAGYVDDGGTVYYFNGRSYCGFVSQGHLRFYQQVFSSPSKGRRSQDQLRQYFGQYTGPCSLPTGYFDNGQAVFYSFGNGTYCGFANPQALDTHGKPRGYLPRLGRIDIEPDRFLKYTGACDPNMKARIALDIPYVEPQNDDWSCGPNSAARFLKFYGWDASYPGIRRAAAATMPQLLRDMEVGTTPHALRDTIKPYRPEIVLKRGTNLTEIISALYQRKPVIALLRVGSIKLKLVGERTIVGRVLGDDLNPHVTAPALHWVVIYGLDENARSLLIQDTNGGTYPISYDKFNDQWNWSVGSGVVKEAIDAEGVTTRTILY